MRRNSRGDGGARCRRVGRRGDPFLFLRRRRVRELHCVGLGDRDVGGACADLGRTVIENPFDRPDQSFSSKNSVQPPRPTPDRHAGMNFLCHDVRFSFALAIPVGARCTTTPHSCNAVLIPVSPFTGPFNPRSRQVFPLPLCSSCRSIPRCSDSRSARSRVRSMPVRKLKSWSMPWGVIRSACLI